MVRQLIWPARRPRRPSAVAVRRGDVGVEAAHHPIGTLSRHPRARTTAARAVDPLLHRQAKVTGQGDLGLQRDRFVVMAWGRSAAARSKHRDRFGEPPGESVDLAELQGDARPSHRIVDLLERSLHRDRGTIEVAVARQGTTEVEPKRRTLVRGCRLLECSGEHGRCRCRRAVRQRLSRRRCAEGRRPRDRRCVRRPGGGMQRARVFRRRRASWPHEDDRDRARARRCRSRRPRGSAGGRIRSCRSSSRCLRAEVRREPLRRCRRRGRSDVRRDRTRRRSPESPRWSRRVLPQVRGGRRAPAACD